MKRRSIKTSVLSVALVLAFALAGQSVAQGFAASSLDEEYLAYSREFPGFGGLFDDDEGVVNVYLTDLSKSSGIESLVATDSPIRFLQADYDFAELYSFHGQLTNVLSEKGVVFLDIDERLNRVHIGIEADALSSQIENRLEQAKGGFSRRYGVPQAAIVVSETSPVLAAVGLRNRIQPAPGGMRINYSSGRFCTMGFVVRQGATRGFVTNSHCTIRRGVVEGTRYWQPTDSGSNFLGTEIKDPAYSSSLSGCPSGRVCRKSDSALVQFRNNSSSMGQIGRIARPVCKNCGNVTIGSSGTSRFKIKKTTLVSLGKKVSKVGQTTGWTEGKVRRTCVTTNFNGTNVTLLCQNWAEAGSGSGDSGSGVFRGKKLVGIMWGRNSASGNFIYSPIGQVMSELGPFSVK